MEIREFISNCDCYKVYDINEALSQKNQSGQVGFNSEIKDLFLANGIGWKLKKGMYLREGESLILMK